MSKKESNWVEVESENDFRIVGKSTGDWLSTEQRQIKVIVFANGKTGELKLFERKIVEKIGKNNLKL